MYNADNVARVRRDEAAAKAAEEAEEQRMQEVDGQRRLAVLRGERPLPLESEDHSDLSNQGQGGLVSSVRRRSCHRAVRRRHGEDDTAYEMRLARENGASTTGAGEDQTQLLHPADLIDSLARGRTEKNEEAEAEARKKRREYEDQYTMRFSNAAGKGGLRNPWYSQSQPVMAQAPSKDVWGNIDPGRKDRDAKRTDANDPLFMMKQGASRVRELKKERRKLQEEREEDLKQLQREERHREKRRSRDERHSRDRRLAVSGDRRSSRPREAHRRGKRHNVDDDGTRGRSLSPDYHRHRCSHE